LGRELGHQEPKLGEGVAQIIIALRETQVLQKVIGGSVLDIGSINI
jgi:hypothetical protein